MEIIKNKKDIMTDLDKALFVIIELNWLDKVKDHTLLTLCPLKIILELIMGIPECFNYERSELVLNSIIHDHHINHKHHKDKLTPTELIDRLTSLVTKTIEQQGVPIDKFVYYKWLDDKSVILVSTKLVFEWI